jgi:glutamine synthetase adenylyltransferase
MKVTEHYFDVKTGQGGVREVEADVMTEAEADAKEAKELEEQTGRERLQELRERLIDDLLGDPASPDVRAEYQRLRIKHGR